MRYFSHTLLDSEPSQRSHTVEWRLPKWAYERFTELLDMLQSLEPGTPDHQALQEEVRALPNFPRYYDPDRDLIIPVVTTVTSR